MSDETQSELDDDALERLAIQEEAGEPMPAPEFFDGEERAATLAADGPTPWDGTVLVASASFWTQAPAARDWLLIHTHTGEGVLVAGKVAGLVAEGGVGKTQLVMDLSAAVATGGLWLGCLEAAKAGRVLVLLAEEDADEAQRRGYTSCRSAGAVPADGAVTVMPLHGMTCAMLELDERRNVIETAFLAWLREWLTKNGPFALVVLDPLTRFAGPEAEKDNAQATRFVQAVESLVVASGGATILVAHHTAKVARAGGDVGTVASRGSSALTDGFRWVATMAAQHLTFDDPIVAKRLGEIVTVAVTKSNYSVKGEPVVLRRGEGGALVRVNDADLELVRAAQSGATTRAAKVAEREAERDRVRLERDAKEASLKADREAAAGQARRQRDAADDDAARSLIRETPDASTRDLVARLKALRTCGYDRAADALNRVRAGAP